jgi:miniconductance mechanosensitive channel
VVKVKGGDNTVYSMPTYNLVSVPFKNWRNVKESGARRLRLAFPVDTLSLAMLTAAQKEALRAEGLWRVPDGQAQVTNLEAYRYWAQSYLDSHAAVHTASARLVKIGDPTGRGIPVEMVFHSKVVASPDWELLRSQLYCHYLAVLPVFGLRVFQEPVGAVGAVVG